MKATNVSNASELRSTRSQLTEYAFIKHRAELFVLQF